MFGRTTRGLASAVALLLAAAGAQAHVLDKKDDKAAFKLRADVAKQVAKYTSCLTKAAMKCEGKGVFSTPECGLATGSVAYETPAGKESAKFLAAIAKCEDKLNLTKKGIDYLGIGCPGDCNTGVAGVQQCADLPAYEATVSPAVRAQLGVLATAIDGACASTGTVGSEARIECVEAGAKELSQYGAKLFKCQRKCELDDKGTKGGGAITNGDECLVGPGAAAALTACDGKAATKLTNPAAIALRPLVATVINDATDALFNRSDPTGVTGAETPCGTCGNNDREGTEVCDGSELGTCDVCAADCTCAPAVCGNGVIEGTETCDGAALGSCLVCDTDCECAPPECGNDIIEGTEACDGTALGSCDACAGDCTCAPLAVCGNNVVEGTEACDGTALGSCDACAGDCTCTAAVCGNGVIEGGEDCDGAVLGSCSLCASDCACAVDPILDGPAGTFCSTALNTATTDYQALCAPTAGSGRHFRIEGAQTTGNNGFFYLAMGFPAAPTGNPTIAVGDGRFIFTGGKSVSCPYAWTYFRYSGVTDPSALCAVPSIFGEYPNGPQTVCMDVSSATPPRVTFWATGANGANCKDASTLTAATALYSKNDWVSANNQPVNETSHFVKLNNTALVTATSASVSSSTVLP